MGADLADMQLVRKYNKRIRFLLCIIHLFSKLTWVVSSKGKRAATIVDPFQSFLNNSGRKPNKVYFDQSSEFCNKSFKNWLDKNDIKTYSAHTKGNSVVTEGFVRTLIHKIDNHMTAVSKNVYFDALDDIVDKYNNTYHRTI